jgi:sulfite exporter TauE/SafE
MLEHLHSLLVPGLAPTEAIIALPMLVAGLAGGFTHCAGMCGPFVLAQVAGRLENVEIGSFGAVARLRTAALLPYHLGRLTTYTLLGAVAGGLSDAVSLLSQHVWIPALFLTLSAVLFLAQAFERSPRLPWLDRRLSQGADGLVRNLPAAVREGTGMGGYVLGVALGFLPCGMLYGALAASVGCGTSFAGGIGMAAFALGTFPALFAVGYGGMALGQRRRAQMRMLARPVMVLNAVLLLALAAKTFAA